MTFNGDDDGYFTDELEKQLQEGPQVIPKGGAMSNLLMPKPHAPTAEEIQRDSDLMRWEYDQEIVNVHSMEDPPNSREPIVNVRRRIVGPWEYVAREPVR